MLTPLCMCIKAIALYKNHSLFRGAVHTHLATLIGNTPIRLSTHPPNVLTEHRGNQKPTFLQSQTVPLGAGKLRPVPPPPYQPQKVSLFRGDIISILNSTETKCATGFEFSRRLLNGVFNVYIFGRFSVLEISQLQQSYGQQWNCRSILSPFWAPCNFLVSLADRHLKYKHQ